MTTLQTINAAANWNVRVNENFKAVSPAASFGIKDSTTTGLTLGYYGGIIDGVSYADGTHLLTASTTRYVVAARATGAVSSATGTTNWNDTTNYKRMGVAVVGTSTITTWTDWREFSQGAATGGTVTSVDASGGVETAGGTPITGAGTIRGAITQNAQTGTSYTVLTGDRGKLVTFSNASAVAVTLPQATPTFGSGWYFFARNIGAGTATITPTTSTIDGSATLVLATNQCALVVSNGTNYITVFVATGSGAAWGAITGTLASQTDLQAALDLKQNRSPNVQSVASSATVTPTFSNDMVKITAQAAGLTLANPTGTAIDGLGIVIRIKDNGTARGISYGTQYRAIGVTLPTTTVISKTTYLAMVFNNDDTKWDVVAVGQEA